jgi:hypothetical protein
MHDRVVGFLAARDVLMRVGAHLVAGGNAYFLTEMYSAAVRHELFTSERAVLQECTAIKITNSMLEGW